MQTDSGQPATGKGDDGQLVTQAQWQGEIERARPDLTWNLRQVFLRYYARGLTPSEALAQEREYA